MNLQQVQYFKTVAEIGHVTESSEILHISQPAISMAISNLEAELGVPLFTKGGHRLQLTPYGKILLEHVSVVIQEINTAVTEINNLALSEKQVLRIASTYSLSSSLLPSVIQPFIEENPNTIIQINQGPNLELLKGIANEEYDFIFGRILPDQEISKYIQHLSLYTEELAILLNSNHPMAGKDELELGDLKNEDFIFFHESTGFHLLVMNLFQAAGYKPNIRYQVYDNASCANMVAANLGVALVGPTPGYDHSRVRQIKLKSSKENQTNIFLLWNSKHEWEPSGLRAKFFKHIQKLYEIGNAPNFLKKSAKNT
ncbi:putative HTH-type transcriptional regulator YybE [Spirochaetia bacterium]|nr:putative HTH-type transcriptional regulator YybE [Spirochaetia bacterium]